MTEQEVLEKLTAYKDVILKIKKERDELKIQIEEFQSLHQKYDQLKQFSDNVQLELEKAQSQNGFYKSDIEKLQKQLEDIQVQMQQSKSKDDEAKNAFMNELGRVLKDAEDILQDE